MNYDLHKTYMSQKDTEFNPDQLRSLQENVIPKSLEKTIISV